jgi:hypothetical protein
MIRLYPIHDRSRTPVPNPNHQMCSIAEASPSGLSWDEIDFRQPLHERGTKLYHQNEVLRCVEPFFGVGI